MRGQQPLWSVGGVRPTITARRAQHHQSDELQNETWSFEPILDPG